MSNPEESADSPVAASKKRDRAERPTNDAYVAYGAHTDFTKLLDKYLAMSTSTFEDFVKLWKETKFSEIYCGRESFAELLELTEELMIIAKTFILPPHSQIKRIGALYLMYGLYTQQPTQGCVKYRVTPEEWSIILKFVENLKMHGFIDANYIFHKMCLDGAFLTVFHAREYGLERNMRKYLMPWPLRDGEIEPSSVFSLEALLSRACRSTIKTHVNTCRTKYNEIKNALEGMSTFQPLPGTDADFETFISADIESDLKSAEMGYQRTRIRKKAFVAGSNLKSRKDKRSSASKSSSDPSSSQAIDSALDDIDELKCLDDNTGDEYLLQGPSALKIKHSSRKSKRIRKPQKSLVEDSSQRSGSSDLPKLSPTYLS